MASFAAVYDACVPYPAPLPDLLMHLAMTDLYRAKWTQQIHQEWMRNVLASRPELEPHLIDLNPARVVEAVARHRASLKNPPKTQDEYLDTLLKQGLPEAVVQLR